MTELEVLDQARKNKEDAEANAAEAKNLASFKKTLIAREKILKKDERAVKVREKACLEREAAIKKGEENQEQIALRKKQETRYQLLRAEFVPTLKIPWGTRLVDNFRVVDAYATLEKVYKVSCITPYSIEVCGTDVFDLFLKDAEKHGYIHYADDDAYYRTLLSKLTVLWQNFGQTDPLPMFWCKTGGNDNMQLCIPFGYYYPSDRYSRASSTFEIYSGLKSTIPSTLNERADDVYRTIGLHPGDKIADIIEPDDRGNRMITTTPSFLKSLDFKKCCYLGHHPFKENTRCAFCESTWRALTGVTNIRLIANYSKNKWQVDFYTNTMPVSAWAQNAPSAEPRHFFEEQKPQDDIPMQGA